MFSRHVHAALARFARGAEEFKQIPTLRGYEFEALTSKGPEATYAALAVICAGVAILFAQVALVYFRPVSENFSFSSFQALITFFGAVWFTLLMGANLEPVRRQIGRAMQAYASLFGVRIDRR